ncbi:branched-chain-amino-acid aminotransferase, cytosolic isoform X3, partial [Biomphalaria glabrata]
YKDLQITLTKTPTRTSSDDHLKFGAHISDHMLEVDWTAEHGWDIPQIKPVSPLHIHPAAKVLHYASEIFEGLKAYRCVDGKVRLFRPREHLRRMSATAERACLPAFDQSEFLKCIQKLISVDQEWVPDSKNQSLYVRPTLIGTEPTLGVSASNKAKLFVITTPVGSYFAGGLKPFSLLADPKYVRAWTGGCGGYKMGSNYAPTVAVQKKALEKYGCQQVLWLFGDDHQMTEIGTMNLFIYWVNEQGEKELLTPSLESGLILPGITRKSVLELSRQWKEFYVTEGNITMKTFIKAWNDGRIMEVFGSGTASIVLPVQEICYLDQKFTIPTDTDTSLTQRLFNEITSIHYYSKPHHWMETLDPEEEEKTAGCGLAFKRPYWFAFRGQYGTEISYFLFKIKMAVIKTPDTKTSGDIGVIVLQAKNESTDLPSSPAPSYTGSQGSHSLLLPACGHVTKEEARTKKRKAILLDANILRQQRFKNILWLLLFSSLFALAVCVVITLANSFQDGFFFKGMSDGVICTPFGTCEAKRAEDNNSPITHIQNPDFHAGYTQQQCIHQRALWEGGSYNSEIIHDLKTKWSALVDHNEQRCLLFEIHLDAIVGCPQEYPWFLDMRVGIPVCRTILDRIAPIRRVMRHILDDDVQNLTYVGYITSRKCSRYKTAVVDKVIVQYFDINNNRIARRSVEHILSKEQMFQNTVEEKNQADNGQQIVRATRAAEQKSDSKDIAGLRNTQAEMNRSEEEFLNRFLASLEKKLSFTESNHVSRINSENERGKVWGQRRKRNWEARKMKDKSRTKHFKSFGHRSNLTRGNADSLNEPKHENQAKSNADESKIMKLPRTRRETLTDKIAHTETFRDPSHQENAEKSDIKHLLTDSRHQENAEKSDIKHLLTDSRHQDNAEKSDTKHLLTDSRHQENAEKSDIKHVLADSRHQKNAEKSYIKHLLTDSRHQENVEKSDVKHLRTGLRHQENAEKSDVKHLRTGLRHHSFKDFAYGTMNPEAHGHWELVVSSINEDGKALFSEKFKTIPESLESVNQYVKPLLRDVMNVIQSVVKSDLVNKPTH